MKPNITRALILCVIFSSLTACANNPQASATTTGTPPVAPTSQTPADMIAQAESSTWFKSIRPTVATLGSIVINSATTTKDKHDKELIVYDASHSFWSLTGTNNFDPNAITAVVGGWLPSKPWWNTALNGFGLALVPVKTWISNTIAKYGGIKGTVISTVINDALNQAALGCEDCTYTDLGFPAPPS
jgi:hypothetical protein